jgi:hypothetical protein
MGPRYRNHPSSPLLANHRLRLNWVLILTRTDERKYKRTSTDENQQQPNLDECSHICEPVEDAEIAFWCHALPDRQEHQAKDGYEKAANSQGTHRWSHGVSSSTPAAFVRPPAQNAAHA